MINTALFYSNFKTTKLLFKYILDINNFILIKENYGVNALFWNFEDYKFFCLNIFYFI